MKNVTNSEGFDGAGPGKGEGDFDSDPVLRVR